MPTQRDVERLQALREAKRRGMLGPTQSAAVGELENRFSQYFKEVGDRAKSVVEPAMTAASAAFAEPVSGLVGLAALPFGADVSTRAIERTQDAMTYQPRTEAGQQGLQGLMSFLGPVGEAIEGASSYLGDNVYEATGSPAAGAAAYSVPAMGLELLGLKGTRAASKAGKLGKQLEMGDIGRGNVGANQRGIFAGVKAKTADMDALNKAQEMMAQGASRDEVWADTGWFKDVDGAWKFEIDDSASRATDMSEWSWAAREDMKAGNSVSGPVGEFLQHDQLANNYDGIVDFGDANRRTVMSVNRDMGANGGFDPDAGRIDIGMDGQGVNRSTGLHEIQHNVQEMEDFARGGSAKTFATEMRAAKQAAERDLEDINRLLKKTFERMEEKRIISPNDADGLKRLEDQYLRLMKQRQDLVPVLQTDILEDSYRQYQRLAGEAEARNVETRMNMTPDERRAKPPWSTLDVPEDELIVRRGGGGVAESAANPNSIRSLKSNDIGGVGNSLLDDIADYMDDDGMTLRQAIREAEVDEPDVMDAIRLAYPPRILGKSEIPANSVRMVIDEIDPDEWGGMVGKKIDSVVTEPEFRGKGVSRSAVAHKVNEIKKQSPEEDIVLLAEPMDDTLSTFELVEFYRSIGFEPIDDLGGGSGVPMRFEGFPKTIADQLR